MDRLTLAAAVEALSPLGVALSSRPGEYVVNFRDGKAATAYYTDDLADALRHGLELAESHRDTPPAPAVKRIHRRALVRRHNRRMAGILRARNGKARAEAEARARSLATFRDY